MGPRVPFLDVGATYGELHAELDAAYRRVMGSGWYILGAELEAFEQEFAAYCGVRHCIGVANGLDALHLVLRAYGVGPGDEVIVPSNTYIATWLAVSYAGAKPVPVEPEPDGFNLDAERVAAAITPRTRAIMPVHLYGEPAAMGPLMELARRHDLRVVEDAAQAHGARLHGRRCGGLGDAAGFSFYPGKNLGAYGDGGAVTTNSDALAERVRMLRNYGSRRKYYNEIQGFNSRLDPLQAAFLRAKLPHLDSWNRRRQDIAQQYLSSLAGLPGIELPSPEPGSEPVWHLFVIRSARRDELQRALARSGIETLIHYPVPPHRAEAYAGQISSELPIAESLAGTVLSLPMGPHMNDEQVRAVITEVQRYAHA